MHHSSQPPSIESERLIPPLHIGDQLIRWMLFVVVYGISVTAIVQAIGLPKWSAGNETAAMLGTALGILIVFRNNTANDRWWEARKLWGQLVNESRNLALKVNAHADVELQERQELGRLLAAFPDALRLHLRNKTEIQAVPGFENEKTTFPHAPGYIAGKIHQTIGRWNQQGRLRETVWVLDVHARALMDVCGACERIRNTPLPASFRSLLRWGILLNVLIVPWSTALEIGWWGVPVVVLGIGFLMGMELTAEAVEEPFGTGRDDLNLDHYCRIIATFVEAELGGTPD